MPLLKPELFVLPTAKPETIAGYISRGVPQSNIVSLDLERDYGLIEPIIPCALAAAEWKNNQALTVLGDMASYCMVIGSDNIAVAKLRGRPQLLYRADRKGLSDRDSMLGELRALYGKDRTLWWSCGWVFDYMNVRTALTAAVLTQLPAIDDDFLVSQVDDQQELLKLNRRGPRLRVAEYAADVKAPSFLVGAVGDKETSYPISPNLLPSLIFSRDLSLSLIKYLINQDQQQFSLHQMVRNRRISMSMLDQ